MKTITMILSLFSLLLVSSLGYATVPVSVNSQGVTFPDNTLQKSAAILPVCQPGEVYVKVNTGMLCAKIKLIPNGIATCIAKVCTVSSCVDGVGNCDGLNPMYVEPIYNHQQMTAERVELFVLAKMNVQHLSV